MCKVILWLLGGLLCASCNQSVIGKYYSIQTNKNYIFVRDSLFIFDNGVLKEKYVFLIKDNKTFFYKRSNQKQMNILRVIKYDNFTYKVIYSHYGKSDFILKQNI